MYTNAARTCSSNCGGTLKSMALHWSSINGLWKKSTAITASSDCAKTSTTLMKSGSRLHRPLKKSDCVTAMRCPWNVKETSCSSSKKKLCASGTCPADERINSSWNCNKLKLQNEQANCHICKNIAIPNFCKRAGLETIFTLGGKCLIPLFSTANTTDSPSLLSLHTSFRYGMDPRVIGNIPFPYGSRALRPRLGRRTSQDHWF